jgi:hypothetical protein
MAGWMAAFVSISGTRTSVENLQTQRDSFRHIEHPATAAQDVRDRRGSELEIDKRDRCVDGTENLCAEQHQRDR